MSLRQRGQEVTLRVAVDGQVLAGSMLKVEDFTATPRTDLNEDDFLGETESDLDIQHQFKYQYKFNISVNIHFLNKSLNVHEFDLSLHEYL